VSRVPTSANQQRPDREKHGTIPGQDSPWLAATGKYEFPAPVLTPHVVPEDMETKGWESLLDLQFHWDGSCRLRVNVSREGVKLNLREHCDGARVR
jgi:hypothetical protein